MTRSRVFIALALFSLALSGVLLAMPDNKTDEIKTDPKEIQAFAGEINQFGFDLFQQLRRQPGNVFFSPYSVSSALAMTNAGARNETATQMSKVLHISDNPQKFSASHQALMQSILGQPKGYDIRIANALWGQNQHPFLPDYINLVQRYYKAEARSMDFVKQTEQSRQTINQWVATQTNDRIKDLMPQGSIIPLTRLVLTNAIYFKGTWATPFEKRMTRPLDFFLTSANSIKSDMMNRVGTMRYSETDDTQVLELPYQGDRLSMVVVLPRKKEGLDSVEAGLNTEKFNSYFTMMKSTKVMLTLPKIKTTYSVSLNKTLPEMGMVNAFDQEKADFSGMDGTRELSISEVVHKAFCEVNEEGTEAAAATGVAMVTRSSMPQKEPPPVEFKADHPYLYIIRDMQTGSLLFLGRVTDPRN